jgi:hypothetical protein
MACGKVYQESLLDGIPVTRMSPRTCGQIIELIWSGAATPTGRFSNTSVACRLGTPQRPIGGISTCRYRMHSRL